jgi:hypothetical protein
MKSPQLPPRVIVHRPRLGSAPERSKYLKLCEVSKLIAHAAVMTKDDLTQASASQIYATDRDEFVDLSAHQSVNTNPSTNKGVRA